MQAPKIAQTVEIPLKTIKMIERVLQKIEKTPEQVDWIEEEEARKLLGRNGKMISEGRLYNMRYEGKIPPSYYTAAVNGKVFYNKQKLMGL